MDAQKHPIDYETLSKGDVITIDNIEKVTGISSEDVTAFSLARLALMQQIDSELQKMGIQLTIAQVKGEIKVLTDEEASAYNNRMRQSALGRLCKAHTKLSSVDASEFSDELKEKHERRVYISSKYLQAFRTVRKEIAAAPHKRNTPVLLE